MILPQGQDRSVVVFHVWPSLAYPTRIAAGFALIAAALVVQVATMTVLPGVLLVVAGNLLLLVRGYDNRVDYAKFDPAAEWERVDVQRLDDLRKLHREMRTWDTSALDISNALGAVLFLLIACFMGTVAWLFPGAARILVIDAMLLLLPHWLTGFRSILVMPKLMVRVKMIQELLQGLAGDLADHRVHLLMLLRSGATRIPDDVKFKVDVKDHHEEFLGLYGQVVLNEVQGKSYPYFYVVLVARRGFGLSSAAYSPPSGVTTEIDVQDRVEVLVIRQTTTKTSGYHTKVVAAARILRDGLRLAERLGIKNRSG